MEQEKQNTNNELPFDLDESNLLPKTQKLINKMDVQLKNEKEKVLPKIKLRKDASELIVITKAKDFVKYVINASGKMPKSYRHTFMSRIQNLALSIIEGLIRANDLYVTPNDKTALDERARFQAQAQTDLKVLEYLVSLAVEEGAMLVKQYEVISRLGTEVGILISKWRESDKRRFIG